MDETKINNIKIWNGSNGENYIISDNNDIDLVYNSFSGLKYKKYTNKPDSLGWIWRIDFLYDDKPIYSWCMNKFIDFSENKPGYISNGDRENLNALTKEIFDKYKD